MNAESKPVCELTEEQLDRVSGGGTKSATKDPLPTESISLNFTKIAFKYDQYDGDTVVASGTEKKWNLTTAKEY